MDYVVVGMNLIVAYMFILQLLGILYCFNVINSHPDSTEGQKFIARVIAVFLGFTVPWAAIILGCYCAAEFTTILMAKRKKRKGGG